MVKYFNPRKLIAWIVVIALTLWFFYAEIRLFANPIIQGFTNTIQVQIEEDEYIRYTPDFAFETKIYVSDTDKSRIDKNRSHLVIFGSKQVFNDIPESNVLFLESASVIEEIPFSDPRIRDTEYGFLFKNSKEVNDVSTILMEVVLFDFEGNSGFSSQLITNQDLGPNLFYGRYSYYVQYLFWYLAIFGSAARGITWSTVYNSKTKRPLSNVIVRIFKDGDLWNTIVTGATGAIQLKLPKGEYKLHAAKTGYVFPSRLAPLKGDGEYRNLYYGDTFKISKDNSDIKLNIPLDSVKEGQEYTLGESALIIGRSITDSFNRPMLLILFAVQVILWPTYIESWLAGLVCLLLILMQYILRYLTTKRKGLVLDKNGKPVPDVKVAVYDSEWGSFLTSTSTDSDGEYEFVLPQGNYLLKIDDDRYEIDNEEKSELVSDSKSILGIKRNTYINKKLILRPKTPGPIL